MNNNSSETLGKKVTLFLADGFARGIKGVKIDQWSGKCICAPREKKAEVIKKHKELEDACLYFLLHFSGGDDNTLEVYIGETDGFNERINVHNNSENKDWYDTFVVFYSSDNSLTKAHVQYLESICIKEANKACKSVIHNSHKPGLPSIPDEDIPGLMIFFQNIKTILPILGYEIFNEDLILSSKAINKLIYTGQKFNANAILLEDSSIKVLKDSKISETPNSSFLNSNNNKLRQRLLDGNIISRDFIFLEDYIFPSKSAAASVIAGSPVNGNLVWKENNNV